jgi:hypothetical protein
MGWEYYDEYECLCTGCFHGEGWIFEAAPAEWFEARKWPTPSWCDECADWRDEQEEIGSIVAICRFCKYQRTFEPSDRIGFHRHVGNWDEYWEDNKDLQLCRMCKEMPSRRRQLMYRDAERKAREENLSKDEIEKQKRIRNDEEHKANDAASTLLTLLVGRAENVPEHFDIPTYVEYYRSIPTRKDKWTEHGPNQLTHIMKDDHEWPEDFGTNSPEDVLHLAHRIANSTESHVFQFFDTRSKMTVKYDTDQRVCIVLCKDKTSPSGHRLHTAFPKSPGDVLGNIGEGHWR